MRLRGETQTDDGTVQSAVKVGPVMRRKQLTRCVQVPGPVGGKMLASRITGP